MSNATAVFSLVQTLLTLSCFVYFAIDEDSFGLALISFLSNATLIIFILTLFLLQLPYISLDCLTIDQFSQQDQNTINNFKDFFNEVTDPKNKNTLYKKHFIAAGSYGQVFVHPDDPFKVIKFQFPQNAHNIEFAKKECFHSELLSQKDQEKEGQFRVAPRVFQNFCLFGDSLFLE